MRRPIIILLNLLLLSVPMFAESGLPIIEVKADRTMIYPQRMELTGEETLMDILQMVPDLMIAGYEDVISNYNLRIDNCPLKVAGIGAVNALYGSKSTDLYANASYRHQEGNKEYLTLHMTNRFDDRNKLLTYFTQQYLDQPSGMSRKVMGRARYFHTFNDLGTELLLVGGYQYASDWSSSSKLPLCIAELNTPLFTKQLSMTLGFEGDFQMTSQKNTDKSWDVFNYDIYLQFTYALPKWRFTVGNRVMFYERKAKEGAISQKRSDTRDNANACVIYVPDHRNQIQLGYYRKFYNPAITEALFEERSIHQMKLAYAYSRQKLTIQTEADYYMIEGAENLTELAASAYWKTKGLSLAGGSNLYIAKSGTSASIRFAPTAYLPHAWQIAMQVVYYTKNSPKREATGVPVYGCLSVNKQFGRHWNVGIDWHDMFDAFCSDATVNRHAANLKLQYRF